jgi:hypothetical protein
MLTAILLQTPRWVFVLFFVLLYAGARQFVARRASITSVLLLPVAFVALSFLGVVNAFAMRPLAMLAWTFAVGLACMIVVRGEIPAGTAYDPATRRLALPGSAVPLVLMMGIFFTKFVVGVTLAQVPSLVREASFALPVSALYGAFSGIFLGRAVRLWRLAARQPARRLQQLAS